MSTTYLNWTLSQPVVTRAGERLVWQFQVKDRSGAVVDITGWTFGLWAVDQADPDNVIEVDDSDFNITDATNGKAECDMARAVTLSQGGKKFDTELWRVDSGFDDELCSGTWFVKRTVRS